MRTPEVRSSTPVSRDASPTFLSSAPLAPIPSTGATFVSTANGIRTGSGRSCKTISPLDTPGRRLRAQERPIVGDRPPLAIVGDELRRVIPRAAQPAIGWPRAEQFLDAVVGDCGTRRDWWFSPCRHQVAWLGRRTSGPGGSCLVLVSQAGFDGASTQSDVSDRRHAIVAPRRCD